MKKLKRLLAFVLSFALMLSGIEPFELKAFAATPTPDGYVSFIFQQGALLGNNNEPLNEDGSNFSNRFTLSNDSYPLYFGDWFRDQDNSWVFGRNYEYYISANGSTEPANIPVRFNVAAPSPDDYTKEVTGNDVSGEVITQTVPDEEAYNAALEAWRNSLDDIYFEVLDDGKFALRVKESELNNYLLNIDYSSDDLAKPLNAYLYVNDTCIYFNYNKAFNEFRYNADSRDRGLDGIVLGALAMNTGDGVDNNVSVRRDYRHDTVLQFNVDRSNEENRVSWTNTGYLTFQVDGEIFTFAIGEIKADGSFDSSSAVVNTNSVSPDFNAYYQTNYVKHETEDYWVIDTNNPHGDPQLVIDASKRYGLKFIDGPINDPNAFDINVGQSHLDYSEEYKAFVIEGGAISFENRQDGEPDGIYRYDVHFNARINKLNNVTVKVEGGATLSNVKINEISVGDVSGTEVWNNKLVGESRAYWSNDPEAEGPFAEFDDITYESATPGYVVDYVKIENPDEDPVELRFNGFDDWRNCYNTRNGVMYHQDGSEFWDSNEYNESTDRVEAVRIKDGATVTFHSKVVWAEINTQDRGLEFDKQLHNEYVENLEEAISVTKDYLEGLSDEDKERLEHINWDIKVKNISLSDDTLVFYDISGNDAPTDESIERYIRINLYSSEDEYGVLTVPAGKTLTFPGQIQGDYTLDNNGNVTAGAKVVLENGAKLNVYTAYDDRYLDGDRLEQRGGVHVYEIAGTNAYITIGTENEYEDQNGAYVDAGKVTGITKVTVNPRSNFNSLIDDYDDYRWNNDTQQDEFLGHVHNDLKADITVGTIELKGKVTRTNYDGDESRDDGTGGRFETDANDTIKIQNITVDRFAEAILDWTKVAQTINSFTVDGNARINTKNAFTITTLNVNGGANVDITSIETAPTITTLNVDSGANVNITSAELLTMETFLIGENAHVNLEGKIKAENLSVGQDAGINTYGETKVGTYNESGNTGSFIMGRRANIRNYGTFTVYADATVYGDSEIRTSGPVVFNKINLVKIEDVNEEGEPFSDSEVRLIRQSGTIEGKADQGSFEIGTLTGDLMTYDEGTDKWDGVRFALYNAGDLDYVWSFECEERDEKVIFDRQRYDETNGEEGWNYERRHIEDPNEYLYGGNGTIEAFPFGETVMSVPMNDAKVFTLKLDEFGNDQKFRFDKIENEERYNIVPESVSFYVAEKDEDGNFPDWNDTLEQFKEDDTVKAFVDSNAILDYINDPANAASLKDKKVYIRVEDHLRVEDFKLPDNIPVQFFNETESDENVLDVVVSDGNFEKYTFDLCGVTLSFANDDDFEKNIKVKDIIVSGGPKKHRVHVWIRENDSLEVEQDFKVGADTAFDVSAKNFTAKNVIFEDNAENAEINADVISISGSFTAGNNVDSCRFNFRSFNSPNAMVVIGDDSYVFFGGEEFKAKKVVVGKNATFGAYHNEEEHSTIDNIEIGAGGLWIYNHGNIDVNKVKVTGPLTFVGEGHINILGHDKKEFAGGVRLAFDSDLENSFQGAGMQMTERDSNVAITGDIKVGQVIGYATIDNPVWKSSIPAESEMRLVIEQRGMHEDSENCDYEQEDVIITVSVGKATTAPDAGKLEVNPGYSGGQRVSYSKTSSDTKNDYYVLRAITEVEVWVSSKNETFKEAALISTLGGYKAAIDYINKVGNTSQKYYVVLPGNVYLGGALELPKAASVAAFEIKGQCVEKIRDDVSNNDASGNEPELELSELRYNGDLALVTDTTFTDVKLVSVPEEGADEATRKAYTASLDTKGKNVVFDRAAFYVDRQIEDGWIGVNQITGKGNLTVKNLNGVEELRVEDKVELKNLTIEQANFRVIGAVTIENEFKAFNDGRLTGMEKDSTFKGNVYLQESGISLEKGTATFKKNVYAYCAQIELENHFEWNDRKFEKVKEDFMWRVVNHKDDDGNVVTANVKVEGKSYLRQTVIAVTGNVTLGELYSDRDVQVLYGVADNATFTVKKVTEVRNAFEFDWGGFDDEPFVWAPDKNWSSDFSAEWDPGMHYFVVGDACDKEGGFTTGDCDVSENDFTAYNSSSEGVVNVRRASIEKDVFDDLAFTKAVPGNYENLYRDADWKKGGLFAAEIAKLYKEDEQKTNIVNTSEDPIKFILGGYYPGDRNGACALYTFKSTKFDSTQVLVIDNVSDHPVLLSVVPNLSKERYESFRIGYYDTLKEAFDKITKLNNKSVGYSINILKSDGGDKPYGTAADADLTTPEKAYKIMINNQADGDEVTFKFKEKLTLKTNLYMNGISLDSASDAKFDLASFALELDECDLTDIDKIAEIKGKDVTGTSKIEFSFGPDAVEEYKSTEEGKSVGYLADGKYAIKVGTIDKVGTLAIRNLALTATDAVNVGNIDASAYVYYVGEPSRFIYYDANGEFLTNDPADIEWNDELGRDVVYKDVSGGDPAPHIVDYENSVQEWGTNTSIDGYTKLIVTAEVTAKDLKVTPKLSVSKAIICDDGIKRTGIEGEGESCDWVEVPTKQVFTIAVLNKADTTKTVEATLAEYSANANDEWKEKYETLKKNGIPFMKAAKANGGLAKYDRSAAAPYKCEAAKEGGKEGIYVKDGDNVCYSNQTFAPYTIAVGAEEAKVADALSWAKVNEAISKINTKQDYVIILNHDPDADKAGATSIELAPVDTAETLTMPKASLVKSLKIKSAPITEATTVPGWLYRGDTITFTTDTTLENINFIGMNGTDELKETTVEGALTTNCNALTLSAPVNLTISGRVSTNGRAVVVDGGKDKKGSLTFANNASVLSKNIGADASLYNIKDVGAVKNMKSVYLSGRKARLAPYYAKLTDYSTTDKKGNVIVNAKLTDPEFTATNVHLKDAAEDIELEGGKVNITTLMQNEGSVEVKGGSITVKDLVVFTGGRLNTLKGTEKTGSSITITNFMTSPSESKTFIESEKITISGKSLIYNDNVCFSGYEPGKLEFKGNIDITEGYTIKLNPYTEFGEDDNKTYSSIVAHYRDTEGAEAPGYVFAKAPKASPAAIFKAATVSGDDAIIVSAFDGLAENASEFFLYKNAKDNTIMGYNGNSVKATVYVQTGNIRVVDGFYVSYADAIASMNDKTQDYYLKIYDKTSSLNNPIELTAPDAKKAKSLTVYADTRVNVYYKKAPAFKNMVTLDTLKLVPVTENKGADKATNPYVTTGYDIKVDGAYLFGLTNVTAEEGAIKNITAKTGFVQFIDEDGLNVSGDITAKSINMFKFTAAKPCTVNCTGSVSADVLGIYNSKLTGAKKLTAKTVTAQNSAVDFAGEISITDINALDNDFTINFGRKTETKSTKKDGITVTTTTDKGSLLDIKGKVTGEITLVMVVELAEGETESTVIDKYTLKEDETTKKVALDKNKVGFSGKNVETTTNVKAFKVKLKDAEGFLNVTGIIPVKAGGAFYIIKLLDGAKASYLASNAVALKVGEDGSANFYLDYSQAVARIKELNDPSAEYTISSWSTIASLATYIGTNNDITDTCVTDSDTHSKLMLPEDNRCAKLTVDTKNNNLLYQAAAITAYGTVDFSNTTLKPVAKADKEGAAVASADTAFTLKANSKAKGDAKVSELILSQNSPLVVKSIAGVKGLSKLTLTGTELVSTTSIKEIGTITLKASGAEGVNKSRVVTAKATTIGTIDSDNAGNEFITTDASTADNLVGSMILYTYYTEDNNHNKTSKFTLNGLADVGESGKITVWPYKTKVSKITTYDEFKETIGEAVEDKEAPLLLAKKADASAFKVSGMASGWVAYKDSKGQVLCADESSLLILVEGDDFKTYAKTWEDAVKIVTNAANKTADYTFTILKAEEEAGTSGIIAGKGHKTSGALETPSAAHLITVKSKAGVNGELLYTGALAPACGIIFENVKLKVNKINTSSAVTIGFTKDAYNVVDGETKELKFNEITLSKGTLYLDAGVKLKSDGKITVGNLDYDGDAEIIPVASEKKEYAAQSYGTITSSIKATAPGKLTLSNYFTKKKPTEAKSQLSITGKVDPEAQLAVKMYNAKYSVSKDKKGVVSYKEKVLGANEDPYEQMTIRAVSDQAGTEADGYNDGFKWGFMPWFLRYEDTSKAPTTSKALLSAPFVSMDRIKFIAADGEVTFAGDYSGVEPVRFEKVGGNFYYVNANYNREVKLDIDTNHDGDYEDACDRVESFLTWDAAVTELNKITDASCNYKLTLLKDVGKEVLSTWTGKDDKKKQSKTFNVIKSITMSKINMPAKVDSLTIEGNGNSFKFSSPSIAVNSNITLKDVSFIAFKSVKDKVVSEDADGNKYTYQVPTYITTPVEIKVSAGRTLKIDDYVTRKFVATYADGEISDLGISTFSSITGTATSVLELRGGGLPTIGKIATFLSTRFNNGDYNITGDLNVKNLNLINASVNAGNVTSTENMVIYSGNISATGAGNMKLKNIQLVDNGCSLIAKANAKGASLLNISGDITAGEGVKINIGIMHTSASAENPLFVSFTDGQTVATVAKAANFDKFTLYTASSEDGLTMGHVVGNPAEFEDGECVVPGWYLDYVTKSKAVVFKRATN